MVIALPTISQNTSVGKIKTLINPEGDTLIILPLEDAKTILSDLLQYEITDSILEVYKERDSLNLHNITLQKDIITNLSSQNSNLKEVILNFEQIQENQIDKLILKDNVITNQKKEIRKQKFQKIMGFIGSVVLPVLTLIVLI
tara:strand:- start:1374 stop:1802 length:429 start_codon:yes stop_codon:yes gene_type:complete